jgi:fumarate reductase subunit C
MLVNPDRIGPFESADRVWSDHFWILYLVMLFVVEIHGGVGLYRLAVKWGFFSGKDVLRARRRLRAVKWGITVFLIVLGLATLAAYVKIGIEHAPDYGERYAPSWVQESAGGAP